MKKTSHLTLILLLVVTFLLGLEITKFEYQTIKEIEVTDLKLCSLAVVDCGIYEPVLKLENALEGVGSLTKYAWTGNKMANGEYPYIGAVAISDRDIPLGSKFIFEGNEYDIKDYTALWVHKKFGTTVDLYSEESIQEMIAFGRQTINFTKEERAGRVYLYGQIQNKRNAW